MTTPDLSEYLEANTPVQRAKNPSGWEPGIVWNGKEGEITTGPVEREPDKAFWAVLVEDWGLDASTTEVVDGTVQLRAWDVNVGDGVVKRMQHYKASIRSRRPSEDRTDVDALIATIGKKKPSKRLWEPSEGSTLVIPFSDWQIGKGEGGGTEATIARIEQAFDEIEEYIKERRQIGKPIDTVVAIGMGDMIENCTGHYPMQTFSVDLDRRSQKRIVRRLLLNFVDRMVKLLIRLVLGAVPGNHGENRVIGKAFTSLQDNDDLAVFEELAEILAANPERYANVHIPLGAIADDLTMTLDINGINVGFAHGHQMKGGGGSQSKIEGWWKGQALGRQRVADAQILVTGHLHHFILSESTGRTVIQCPAMDGGSQWYAGTSGRGSPAGTVVFCVGKEYGDRGWGDMRILASGSRNV